MTRNQRMPLAGPDTSGDPLGGQVSRRHTTTGIIFFTVLLNESARTAHLRHRRRRPLSAKLVTVTGGNAGVIFPQGYFPPFFNGLQLLAV
jgi:hypothetical protein